MTDGAEQQPGASATSARRERRAAPETVLFVRAVVALERSAEALGEIVRLLSADPGAAANEDDAADVEAAAPLPQGAGALAPAAAPSGAVPLGQLVRGREARDRDAHGGRTADEDGGAEDAGDAGDDPNGYLRDVIEMLQSGDLSLADAAQQLAAAGLDADDVARLLGPG